VPGERVPGQQVPGVPAAWAGLGQLLTAGERAPENALSLVAAVEGGRAAGGGQVDLSGMWALPAPMAAARSHVVLRALDDKGRLQLPVDADSASWVPAERDGALVTVFLPGSPDRPRPSFAAAALPLDGRGRLTLTAGIRQAAGIPNGADVLAQLDPQRRTVTVVAASRIGGQLSELLDALRRPVVVAEPEHAALPAPAPPAASSPTEANAADDAASVGERVDSAHGGLSGAAPSPAASTARRLRSVP